MWISWIRYISFVFYGFSLLVHSEYKDRDIYSCVDPGLLANPAAASVQVGPLHYPAPSWVCVSVRPQGPGLLAAAHAASQSRARG